MTLRTFERSAPPHGVTRVSTPSRPSRISAPTTVQWYFHSPPPLRFHLSHSHHYSNRSFLLSNAATLIFISITDSLSVVRSSALSPIAIMATTTTTTTTVAPLRKRVLIVLTSATPTMGDGKKSGYYCQLHITLHLAPSHPPSLHPHLTLTFPSPPYSFLLQGLRCTTPMRSSLKAQFGVDFVSLTGQATPDEHSISTPEQLLAFELSALNAYKTQSHPLHADIARLKAPAAVKAEEYSIVFFAGGHACLWDFPTATPLQKIAAEVYEEGWGGRGSVSRPCYLRRTAVE